MEKYEAVVQDHISKDFIVYHGFDGKDNYTVQFRNGKMSFGKRCETVDRMPFHDKIIEHFHLNNRSYRSALELIESVKFDAEMALSGEWDRSDEGFKAQIQEVKKLLAEIKEG